MRALRARTRASSSTAASPRAKREVVVAPHLHAHDLRGAGRDHAPGRSARRAAARGRARRPSPRGRWERRSAATPEHPRKTGHRRPEVIHSGMPRPTPNQSSHHRGDGCACHDGLQPLEGADMTHKHHELSGPVRAGIDTGRHRAGGLRLPRGMGSLAPPGRRGQGTEGSVGAGAAGEMDRPCRVLPVRHQVLTPGARPPPSP